MKMQLLTSSSWREVMILFWCWSKKMERKKSRSAGAHRLEEAVNRRTIPGVVKSQKEMLLSLEKFKGGLNHATGGSS
jgi:hypothetical protein